MRLGCWRSLPHILDPQMVPAAYGPVRSEGCRVNFPTFGVFEFKNELRSQDRNVNSEPIAKQGNDDRPNSANRTGALKERPQFISSCYIGTFRHYGTGGCAHPIYLEITGYLPRCFLEPPAASR